MGTRHLVSASVTKYGLVLVEVKIICALEISEDILNSRPMAFCWSCAMSDLVFNDSMES